MSSVSENSEKGKVENMTEEFVTSCLQHSQSWQQAILDSADFTIISTDPQGIIQTCNSGALCKLGYEPEEVIGKVTPVIIHNPQEVAQRAQQLSQELGYPVEPGFETFVAKARLGIPDENIWTYKRKDQSCFPVRLSVTALHDELGNLTGFLGIGKDVTEQQEAKQSLYESEARFVGAFQYAAIGMALVSPEGHWLKVNASVCDIVGYSESELLALTFQDITHPDDLEIDLGYVEQLLAGEIDHYHLEKRYIHKQGHEVWILLSVSLVRRDDGYPLYFISQIQDINQRKQAEAALQQLNADLERLVHERTVQLENAYQQLKISEANYQDLYDNSPDMYTSVDAHTSQVLQCNQTLCHTLGFSKDEILERPILDLYDPECHPQVEETFQTFVDTGEVKDAQLVLQRKDGSQLEVSLNVRAIRDEEGNILHSRSSWRDITGRKRLERQLQQVNQELEERVQQRTIQLATATTTLEQQLKDLQRADRALRDSETRFRALIENTSDMILLINAQGEIQYVSPSVNRNLGYFPRDLLHQTWEDWIKPQDQPKMAQMLRSALIYPKKNLSAELHWQKRDNSWGIFEVISQQFTDSTGFFGIVVNARDINERQKIEAMKLALDREKEISQMKLRLFSMASHEFRTPLSVILMAAQLLEKAVPAGDNGKNLAKIKRIQSTVRHLILNLSKILEIARMETQQIEIKPQRLDLKQFCDGLIEQQTICTDETRIKYTFVESSRDVFLDEDMLHKILTNLLTNALKYSNPNQQVDFQVAIERNQIKFRITDQGIGIPQELHSHLFEAFQRGDNVGNIEGSGLGLAIVKKCVDLHGGQITFITSKQRGTTFTVTLPIDLITSHEVSSL